jgi:hypothetical protein
VVDWPPQCCVAAVVNATLVASGTHVADPTAIPGLLGTRVGPDEANPLGLAITTDIDARGVTAAEAVRRIPGILKTFGSPLGFRHVPLNTISLDQHEEVLAAALKQATVVAVGLNYATLARRETDKPARHVFRVIGSGDGLLNLMDDSGECEPAVQTFPVQEVFHAARAVRDGFWIFGPPAALSIPNTLPWESGSGSQ